MNPDLAAGIIRLLTERKQTLALAESCTGGFLSHLLTNVPGASAAFIAGWVTYSNEAKQSFLRVQPTTLERWGAVSDAVAREMAEGARRASGSDYAVAVTGIAGPGGGSPEKPVGTVFVALASPSETKVFREINVADRQTFKEMTAEQAFIALRDLLLREQC